MKSDSKVRIAFRVFIQVDLLERVPQAFLVMAIIFAVFQVSGLLFLARATQVSFSAVLMESVLRFADEFQMQDTQQNSKSAVQCCAMFLC